MSKIDKEFDERFPTFGGVGAMHPIFKNDPNPNHIKQFIKQKIKEITDEMIGELPDGDSFIVGDYNIGYDDGVNRCRKEIIKIAKKYGIN